MREIKFRAFNKITKYMHEEVYSKDFAYNNETIVHEQGLNDALVIAGNVYELMQFTGLLDKNGKEIYEGDIHRVYYMQDPQVGVITFDNGWFGSMLTASDTHLAHFSPFEDGQGEVIGNIYENPDLLTQPKQDE